MLVVDPTTRKILDANPFMTELLGYTHRELRGKELFEIGLLNDGEASRAAFRELQKNGFIRYEGLPLETRTGERREGELVSNLYQEGGEEVIQCNIRDITERKQAEHALHESHARFESLFDTSPVGMYLLDAELRIRQMSRKARQVFGGIGGLIGRDFVEVVHVLWPPESADEIVAGIGHSSSCGSRPPALRAYRP